MLYKIKYTTVIFSENQFKLYNETINSSPTKINRRANQNKSQFYIT